ncbi:MAG: hypothetical protein M3Q47_18060 [Actinomycetota bacterium]|nr:hypothetical protein [Actinomycetota bacterium]
MHPHTDDDADADRRRPRWVAVTAVIALLAVLLLVVLLLAGGGHGPGRHLSSAGPTGGPLAVAGAGVPDEAAGPRP